jgi:stage V sporulation protein AC
MEFKREGYIFGVGARIFSVAGPTLVFGFVVAVVIGLIKVVFG